MEVKIAALIIPKLPQTKFSLFVSVCVCVGLVCVIRVVGCDKTRVVMRK